MFMAVAAVSLVYELLGKKGLRTDVFPPVENGLINGDLTFEQHSLGHKPRPG
jgi:multidrug efflux pump subunit AcrB